ncbi:PRA1 family protein 3 ADP-ribosylation factor-like protein 6-interacting protein 5 [Triplophysa tibetana]|uniref:PRA1 family protein n=1 Tax=Triplophysa tibetana TaxID=1572043 RepID=A0A5A9NVL4_9TELE|nr:PRA1 family protein 3 ADP-ribosylation factor-like protein 6-interacting protein 5 [Triplophysa tibetana]
MAKVEIAPLRSWDDFFPGSERFSKPDTQDLAKWNNRVVSNLLYYQTNYLLVAIVIFIVVGLWNPVGMFTGGTVITSVIIGSVWAGENKAMIKSFKRDNPSLFVFLALVVSYLLMSLFGGVMVFLLGIKLPIILIFTHASLRLRNMKNKLENKMESAGLKKSPMSIILEALGQQEENISKVQSFLESKLNE